MDAAGDGPATRVADWGVSLALAFAAVYSTFTESLFDAAPGEQQQVQRIAVGLLCLLSAYLWVQVRRSRRELRRFDELLADVRFGPGTKRDRDAVDILLRALRGPDAVARQTALRTLKRISGLDLGEDPAAWEGWWSAARSTFTRAGDGPGPKK